MTATMMVNATYTASAKPLRRLALRRAVARPAERKPLLHIDLRLKLWQMPCQNYFEYFSIMLLQCSGRLL